jgi:hypothetical protein
MVAIDPSPPFHGMYRPFDEPPNDAAAASWLASGSALLVNVDNDTLRQILNNPEAMAAVERIEGFNTEQMNQAVFALRRYEDASLRYTGIDSRPGLTHYGLYDTVVARE